MVHRSRAALASVFCRSLASERGREFASGKAIIERAGERAASRNDEGERAGERAARKKKDIGSERPSERCLMGGERASERKTSAKGRRASGRASGGELKRR